MNGMKGNVQMQKKMLCLSSGKSSKQKEYNTQIKWYKWTQRSGSKDVIFFTAPSLQVYKGQGSLLKLEWE